MYKEQLSPALARTLLGEKYDSNYQYTLITNGDGFTVSAYDSETESYVNTKIESLDLDGERITGLFEDVTEKVKKVDIFRVISYVVIIFVVLICLLVVFYDSSVIKDIVGFMQNYDFIPER
ncbi:MAG: hypothetical protein LBS29_04735 [Endomicrobium sp.]|jgi:hypothetical protein|nr:hypothetical protein [Endomicrobium sp.]